MRLEWPEARTRLEALIGDARRRGVYEPTRMVLTTQDGGCPSSRIVLLKHIDAQGIVFYTNAESRKAGQFNADPQCALFFQWRPDMETVTVCGTVEPVADEISDAYWATRPRLTRIGAWASKQSRPLPSRMGFICRVLRYAIVFLGRPVPRPDFWKGFRVRPAWAEVSGG